MSTLAAPARNGAAKTGRAEIRDRKVKPSVPVIQNSPSDDILFLRSGIRANGDLSARQTLGMMEGFLKHMQKLSILALLSTACAFAQFDTGSVIGTVTDPTSAVVSGVKVTLENVQTGVKQSTTTDSDGAYSFLSQRIGDYRVTAEHAGFKQVS